MKNPIGVTPKHEVPVLLGIKQFVLVLPTETDNIQLMKSKIDELLKIFTRTTFKQCLLFTDTQSKTDSYGNYLNKVGWKNEVINGGQEQSQRLSVLNKLINFQCRILITTDLMARGIDIENINLIINLDLPYDCVTYLHRIGRAGRFGSHGIALTFVNGEEELKKLQNMLGDVGRSFLNVINSPEDSASFDLWNFRDENTLSTGSENIICDSQSKNETILENLTLLGITRKLVDKENDDQLRPFKFSSIIEDYEHSLNQREKSDEENCSTSSKTVEYSQIPDLVNGFEGTETYKSNEQRQLDFQRIETSPESSSSESLLSEHWNFIKPKDQIQKPKSTSNGRSKLKTTYNLLHTASTNYSQWQKIFNCQLTNIQSYVEKENKSKNVCA